MVKEYVAYVIAYRLIQALDNISAELLRSVPILDWGVEEWMKRICQCFTPSRIALAEGARGTVSLRGTLSTRFFFFFFSNKRLYDIHVTRFLHRERDSAPH